MSDQALERSVLERKERDEQSRARSAHENIHQPGAPLRAPARRTVLSTPAYVKHVAVIGSGPTVPDPTTLADARAIVARYKLEIPDVVTRALADPNNESPKPVLLSDSIEGEAREVAAEHAARALALQKQGRRAVILSGGELTVTIRGQGRGGPNQEYALALAVALNGAPGIAALAGDTDGTDGGAGSPNDPAGAWIDQTTLDRASSLGLDPAHFLSDNDSTAFFTRLGDLVETGPTWTNVNDFRAIVVDRL